MSLGQGVPTDQDHSFFFFFGYFHSSFLCGKLIFPFVRKQIERAINDFMQRKLNEKKKKMCAYEMYRPHDN